jgi:predicted GIY-YIG superfamily endonuclease
MSERRPCADILANGERGMSYVGVTSGLVKRLWQRKDNAVDGLIEEVNPAWRDLYPELL